MFSQTMEYALRIMVYLASLSPAPQARPGETGRLPTIAQIALATQIPIGYLAKVLRNLARAGLIRSQRGLHGGSVLARESEAISVLDVVQAVDAIQRIRSCPLGLKSHGVNLCPLHRRLDAAIATVEQAFRNTSLAELVADPSPIRPLSEIPTEPATGLVALKVLLRGKEAGIKRASQDAEPAHKRSPAPRRADRR